MLFTLINNKNRMKFVWQLISLSFLIGATTQFDAETCNTVENCSNRDSSKYKEGKNAGFANKRKEKNRIFTLIFDLIPL